MGQSFRDLVVWQRAMQLTVAVYKLTQEFPREEQYGLTSQIRRSVVSIPSNIAEGQGRGSAGEFRQFLGIARGSNCEVQTQLEIARALNLGSPLLIDKAEALSDEVRKMLFGILDSLKDTKKLTADDHTRATEN
jgi:four helix bundle protein